jgi:hypothetical protein
MLPTPGAIGRGSTRDDVKRTSGGEQVEVNEADTGLLLLSLP